MPESATMTTHDFSTIFPDGLHFCYIFNDDTERVKTMAKFLANSLSTGQKVLNIVDTISPRDVRKEMERLGVKMEEKGKDIVTIDNESAYCPKGTFDPIGLLDGAVAFCKQAHGEGYAGSRICGDMSWVIRKNVPREDLLSYEIKVNDYVKIPPCAALCEYDARKFDGATIMDILSVHPAMIVRGQIVKNPYFTPADEFLAHYRAQRQ